MTKGSKLNTSIERFQQQCKMAACVNVDRDLPQSCTSEVSRSRIMYKGIVVCGVRVIGVLNMYT